LLFNLLVNAVGGRLEALQHSLRDSSSTMTAWRAVVADSVVCDLLVFCCHGCFFVCCPIFFVCRTQASTDFSDFAVVFNCFISPTVVSNLNSTNWKQFVVSRGFGMNVQCFGAGASPVFRFSGIKHPTSGAGSQICRKKTPNRLI
ncbi:unnamed protein product, partial [Polarella glacialis]